MLEQLALHHCHLNDAVVRQLDDSLVGTACRLHLGLDLKNEFGGVPLLQPQLTLLCQGGGWQANLHGLRLGEDWTPWRAVSPLSKGLSPLSTLMALKELTLPFRSIDSNAAQVLGGLTQLATLRASAWEEGAVPTLPASLRHLELLNAIHLGEGGGGGVGDEEIQVPRCIQRVLPAGTKLRVHFRLCYGRLLQECGSLQALLARLGAQLRGWAGLQEALGCRLELSMKLFGYHYRAGCGYGAGGGDMEPGLDRLLPALIEALASVAASIHTLKLSFTTHQLGAAVSASLVRTLPSLRELHISYCHLQCGGLSGRAAAAAAAAPQHPSLRG